ncbi:MAG: hypothetical protein KF784_08670 [Fimbriimonadaceae bacterium]|nr:hypothetical protein [Fimbriimonadaceae bacterium]
MDSLVETVEFLEICPLIWWRYDGEDPQWGSWVERDPGGLLIGLKRGKICEGDVYPVERTSLPNGGFRNWWICPGCSKRRKKLYHTPDYAALRCRVCWGLRYQCQRQNHRCPRYAINGLGTMAYELMTEVAVMDRLERRWAYQNKRNQRRKDRRGRV